MDKNTRDELDFTYEIIIPNQKLLESKISMLSNMQVMIDETKTDNEDVIDAIFDESVSDIDKWDYIVAASSGVLAAAMDILWVKDFSLEDAQSWGKDKADEFVLKIAQKKGYKGNDLNGAIRKLENLFKIPSDELTDKFGGGKQHHLRDFGHHASLLGLCFSILTQFTGIGYGTDKQGDFRTYKVPTDDSIGNNFEQKVFNGVVIWAFHMISDIDGSSGSAGWGTGIPGPLLSFFKEISALPIIKEIALKYKDDDIMLSIFISKLFNGTFFKHDTKEEIIRFDLRTEIGIFHQLTKQAFPIIVNECVVRSIYFIRRLYLEIKKKDIHSISELKELDPKAILPFNNKTVTRMITVSSGTFLLIVTSEAAIKAAIKSKGIHDSFGKDFLLNLNYLGIVRFVFACKADAKYISEDMKKVCQEFRNKYKEKTCKKTSDIPGIQYLTLNEQQLRILSSLERQKITYDIQDSQQEKLIKKQCWLESWESIVTESTDIPDYFIKDEAQIYDLISYELTKSNDNSWLFLIALELALFIPYFPLNSEQDKEFKKLKCEADYESDQFCQKQSLIDPKRLDVLRKTFHKYEGVLNNKTQKILTGAAITVGATVLSGGFALAFAPQIAILIAGESVAVMYGAALTSASLALVGGGSLAVGGLGMAGGTAIIAGGGALLGIAGSGAASFSSVLLLSSKDSILRECAKLMTFCKYVLIDQYNKPEVVKTFQKNVQEGIKEIEVKIASLEDQLKEEDQEKEIIKNLKKYINDSKKSLKSIKRCNEELIKMSK